MRFDAATVVALKMQHKARRLEIRFADAGGMEHVVSLPIEAAQELAKFISDASGFMARLKRPGASSG
jgi:glutamine synthetase